MSKDIEALIGRKEVAEAKRAGREAAERIIAAVYTPERRSLNQEESRARMGEVKHTPGPWEWWTSCSWKRLTSKDESGKWLREGNVLCPSIASDGHPILDVSEEDMALIAAAPEMLEALKITARGLEGEFGPRVAEVNFPSLYAAIDKAEGRS